MRLWDWAGRLWSRPDVREALLALQNDRGQCIPLLMWALWRGDGGDAPDAAAAERAAVLCRSTEDTVIAPLRARRGAAVGQDRERLLAEELEAEHDVLDRLEALPMGEADPRTPNAGDLLATISALWGRPADASSFDDLLAALSSRERTMSDEDASNDEDVRLRGMLAELRQTHREIGAAIEALSALPRPDQLRIARLKKSKLAARDQIARLENSLTPDLIA